MIQTIFERHENKYMLDIAQYTALMKHLSEKMLPDQYGSYTISNLYYDTESFDLIRASIEKPVYKEKLRLRCYGTAEEDTPVFLELKKKFKGVVYKRRATLPYDEAKRILRHGVDDDTDSQFLREIRYFMRLYPVSEKVFICYDRTALSGAEDHGLRVTFDTNVRFRLNELRLDSGTWGTDIMEPGKILMEVKTLGAIPLWLSRSLSECEIFPSSFSKYGTCYSNFLLENIFDDWKVNIGA